MKLPGALLVWLLLTVPGLAQESLRAEDAARLDRFAATMGDALLQAISGGAPQDVAALTRALSGTADIAFDETLAGKWKCRTMRLGGAAPLVVYAPFDCRFDIAAGGFTFEKLTGSQRTKGSIQLRSGRAIYVGVGFAAGESVPSYAELPADFQSGDTVQTHIAVFERISPTRARLMFPSPNVQSDVEILELTR